MGSEAKRRESEPPRRAPRRPPPRSVNTTMLEPSLAGEMTCAMPVINCKAAPADRVESNIYKCPCYKHLRRGPTYVFSAPLKTKAAAAKWVLAGTALVMDVASK